MTSRQTASSPRIWRACCQVATGRSYFSQSDATRSTRAAFSGFRSVVVPAYDANGRLLGAINISTNAARVDFDTLMRQYLPMLQQKARQIRADLS